MDNANGTTVVFSAHANRLQPTLFCEKLAWKLDSDREAAVYMVMDLYRLADDLGVNADAIVKAGKANYTRKKKAEGN